MADTKSPTSPKGASEGQAPAVSSSSPPAPASNTADPSQEQTQAQAQAQAQAQSQSLADEPLQVNEEVCTRIDAKDQSMQHRQAC